MLTMKKSRTVPRNRTFRVQVAKATRQKRENVCTISVPEGVSSSNGFENNRESNPTCNEEATTMTCHSKQPGDTNDNIPSDVKSMSKQKITSECISNDEINLRQKNIKHCAGDTNEQTVASDHMKNTELAANTSASSLDIRSKPIVDYTSLIYKNYPKKIAGIKVTKKFLLMSKGLKWKPLIPDKEINDSMNKENAFVTKPSSKTLTSDPTNRASDISNEQGPSETLNEVQSLVDKNSKSGVQDAVYASKASRSNLKSIMSKCSPKACIKWCPNKTTNLFIDTKSSGNPILKSVIRQSPANVGNHNSSQVPKLGLHSNSSEVSNQSVTYKNALVNCRRSHSKLRPQPSYSQANECDTSKKLVSCMRKKPRGTLRFSEDNIRNPYAHSRIPISINKSMHTSSSRNFLQNKNITGNDHIFATSLCSFPKTRHKGKQGLKISFEGPCLQKDSRMKPRENSLNKFKVINRYLPQDACELKDERDASKSDANWKMTSIESLNKQYQDLDIFRKAKGESTGFNIWKDKVPLLDKNQILQKYFNNTPKTSEAYVDESLDADVREIRNLIDLHRQNVDSKAKDDIDLFGKKANKSVTKNNSLLKDMKVIKTSYPFQSEEPNTSTNVGLPVKMDGIDHKPARENEEDCSMTKTFKHENMYLSSKKEINKVLKMLLKRQDAELKNNLLKYLMEESEKSINKGKVSEGISVRKSVLKNPCSRSSSRHSILTRKKRRESRESSRSSSKIRVSSLSRVESVSPLRISKRCQSKPKDIIKGDLFNRSDTFAEKAKTYKNLYSSSREAINLISEAPKTCSNVLPSRMLLMSDNNLTREECSNRRCGETALFKVEKPFRSWLKNNNLIHDDFREASPRREPTPTPEEKMTSVDQVHRDDTDISHLFSSGKQTNADDSHYAEDSQYYGFDSSPTEYFFNSSQAGINNNNIIPSSRSLIQNINPVVKYDSNESQDRKFIDKNYRDKPHVRTTSINDDFSKRILANLNRRHTKKPIKMSILPCTWQPTQFPIKSPSTACSQCSSISSCGQKNEIFKNYFERKHSYAPTSPDTIRSLSFGSNESSSRFTRDDRARAAFH